MEETRERSNKGKIIVLAVIAVVVIAAICFLSQWKALIWTEDYCKMCATREKTQGNYCDICYEKKTAIFETAFETTP